MCSFQWTVGRTGQSRKDKKSWVTRKPDVQQTVHDYIKYLMKNNDGNTRSMTDCSTEMVQVFCSRNSKVTHVCTVAAVSVLRGSAYTWRVSPAASADRENFRALIGYTG